LPSCARIWGGKLVCHEVAHASDKEGGDAAAAATTASAKHALPWRALPGLATGSGSAVCCCSRAMRPFGEGHARAHASQAISFTKIYFHS
jgi:hypothetical protein